VAGEVEAMNAEELRDKTIRSKAEWHRAQAQLPIKEKVRILLELQKQDLELLRRHRSLKYYEKPWNIEP
jgi:hypothetical protein